MTLVLLLIAVLFLYIIGIHSIKIYNKITKWYIIWPCHHYVLRAAWPPAVPGLRNFLLELPQSPDGKQQLILVDIQDVKIGYVGREVTMRRWPKSPKKLRACMHAACCTARVQAGHNRRDHGPGFMHHTEPFRPLYKDPWLYRGHRSLSSPPHLLMPQRPVAGSWQLPPAGLPSVVPALPPASAQTALIAPSPAAAPAASSPAAQYAEASGSWQAGVPPG